MLSYEQNSEGGARMALSHTNQNITNPRRASDLLGGKELVIRITSEDIQPDPVPDNSISMQPEDPAKPIDPETSFHDALLTALGGTMRNEYAPFWEWLERTVAQNLDAFRNEEVPYGLLRWAKRI